ncbi:MAG: LytTR family DNA-binding domain-containing protein [Chitinophagaceae bacterium]
MKIILIEDEAIAMRNLVLRLQQLIPADEIVAQLRSVQEAIDFLSGKPVMADIIFSDIQLPDGLSFEIFKACQINVPVIFTTAHDEYMMQAMDNNGIDYLLKPFENISLQKALNKYRRLQNHFHLPVPVLQQLSAIHSGVRRILVKRGNEFTAIPVETIPYCFTSNKVVYVVDIKQRKYMVEENNLANLVNQLDEQQFFRANRKYVINIRFVKKFRPAERGRIEVELDADTNESIIISQENAEAFRRWVVEAKG